MVDIFCDDYSMNWSIALKAPAGLQCMHIEQGDTSWRADPAYDIDAWVRDTVMARMWTSHVLANDEPPAQKADSSCAHSKIALFWNAEEVGWLIHSAPRWPADFVDGEVIGDIPPSERRYGQSFVWLPMPRHCLAGVLQQLHIERVHVYATHDPEGLFPAASHHQRIEPCLRELRLSDTVVHVAKNAQWRKDLFDDYCSPTWGGPCRVETWLRPKDEPTASSCNVARLRWPDGSAYHESNDHSKWAVSDPRCKQRWVFVGGINRMSSQWHRGGGGVVIRDDALWSAFDGLIVETDAPVSKLDKAKSVLKKGFSISRKSVGKHGTAKRLLECTSAPFKAVATI